MAYNQFKKPSHIFIINGGLLLTINFIFKMRMKRDGALIIDVASRIERSLTDVSLFLQVVQYQEDSIFKGDTLLQNISIRRD